MFLRRFLLIIPFVILALGLSFLATNVPVQDDYDSILAFLNGSEHLSHILDFHNEHRIATSRIVCEIVYRFLGHIDFRVLIWIGNIGWWIFSALFAYLFTRRGGVVSLGGILATWLLVGFYDHENIFLSMSSMANHWVLAFAFVSCLSFSHRSDIRFFVISLIFAIAATFTSGGGLVIFPSLGIIATVDYVFAHHRTFDRRTIIKTVAFLLTMASSYIVYLHDFPHGSSQPEPNIGICLSRITNSMAFILAFLGNMMPTAIAAIPLGVGIILWMLFVCRHIPRYRNTSLAIFGFLAFCMANVFAASLFRGTNVANALPGRYRLISSAIIVSLAYLTLVEFPFRETSKKKLLLLAILCSNLLSCIYLVRGISYNWEHKNTLEIGIAKWPRSVEGLDYPSDHNRRIHASAILRESVSKGIYRP